MQLDKFDYLIVLLQVAVSYANERPLTMTSHNHYYIAALSLMLVCATSQARSVPVAESSEDKQVENYDNNRELLDLIGNSLREYKRDGGDYRFSLIPTSHLSSSKRNEDTSSGRFLIPAPYSLRTALSDWEKQQAKRKMLLMKMRGNNDRRY